MWPLDTGYISSSYGGRTINGITNYHYATDIGCEFGTPVHASNGGTVVLSEWDDFYGYFVLIDHGNGISTLYAHLSYTYCNPGASVSKGDVIGNVGSSGYAFGSHLHFEYRIDGDRVDPEIYVQNK